VELDPNSTQVTGTLVAALAVVAMVFLMRKRYDSNLPLLFYFVCIVFLNLSSMSVNSYLLVGGLALALILRFEFMGPGFMKFIAYLNTGALGLIVYVFLVEILGSGQAPF
jgi:hypothetical protein